MAPHKRTTMLAAATLGMSGMAVALLPGPGFAAPGLPGPGGPPQSPADTAKAQISRLYQQAEVATQAYDADQERIGRLQAVLAGEGGQEATLRGRLAAVSVGLGRLAAQQYRSSGVDPTLSLILSAHPDSYLAESELASQTAGDEQRELRSVHDDQQALSTLDAQAGRQLAELQADQTALATNRADIQGRLCAARQELNQLTHGERAKVAAALARGDDGNGLGATIPTAAPSLGSLLGAVVAASEGDSADSSRARTAVTAAYNELGKPYVWGATGPDSFDCSGLTQHVWATAGVALPRTSEEQADIGTAVPLTEIQPGDLVVYFPGRTHVGVYVGDGLVIHAPRPGSVVQFATLDSMPIAKVVRPLG